MKTIHKNITISQDQVGQYVYHDLGSIVMGMRNNEESTPGEASTAYVDVRRNEKTYRFTFAYSHENDALKITAPFYSEIQRNGDGTRSHFICYTDFTNNTSWVRDVVNEAIVRFQIAAFIAIGKRKSTLTLNMDDDNQFVVHHILKNDVDTSKYREGEKAFLQALEDNLNKSSEEKKPENKKGESTLRFSSSAESQEDEDPLVKKLRGIQKELKEKEKKSQEFWNGTGQALIGLTVALAGLGIWAYCSSKE